MSCLAAAETRERRDFTYRWLIPAADGEAVAIPIYSGSFAMNSHFPPEEKLALLQGADSRRKWYSLDDQRVCVLCDRTITGRQIEIVSDAAGAYSLRCPTEGCRALPSDWFYHGNAYSGHRNQSSRTEEAIFLWE